MHVEASAVIKVLPLFFLPLLTHAQSHFESHSAADSVALDSFVPTWTLTPSDTAHPPIATADFDGDAVLDKLLALVFDGDRVEDIVLHIAYPDSLSKTDTSEVVIAVMGMPWDRRSETVYELYRRGRQKLGIVRAGSLVDWGVYHSNPFRLRADAIGKEGGTVNLWYGGTFLPFYSSP